MRAAATPVADPQLEFRWLLDPGFLMQGFLIQGLRRMACRGKEREASCCIQCGRSWAAVLECVGAPPPHRQIEAEHDSVKAL